MSDIKPPTVDETWAATLAWVDEQELTTKAIATKTLARLLRVWAADVAVKRRDCAMLLAAEGWTHQDIANLLGVSRARAGQLIEGK